MRHTRTRIMLNDRGGSGGRQHAAAQHGAVAFAGDDGAVVDLVGLPGAAGQGDAFHDFRGLKALQRQLQHAGGVVQTVDAEHRHLALRAVPDGQHIHHGRLRARGRGVAWRTAGHLQHRAARVAGQQPGRDSRWSASTSPRRGGS